MVSFDIIAKTGSRSWGESRDSMWRAADLADARGGKACASS
jgi:hypothetical protein